MKKIIISCNHCEKEISETDAAIKINDDVEVHQDCVADFFNSIAKKKAPLVVKKKRSKGKYEGVFFEKRKNRNWNKWRYWARIRANGHDSVRFATSSFDTEEEAYKAQQRLIKIVKSAFDVALKGTDKKAVNEGHYIDIVDIKKVPKSENVVEGSFGKVDERL